MIPLIAAMALASIPSQAQQPPAPAITAYAVVIGSNQAGPGQVPLRYALDDARRVRDVMVELGGYDLANVAFLGDPDRDDVMEILDLYQERIRAHRVQEEDTVFFFYYSGHAKAQALNLGPDELALSELDARLAGIDAGVTLAVLDACQAGALSDIKGATPAADFSYNAAAGLNTRGMVVLASSTATELSQESEDLGGSYFTHHLVTGLRGAADQDTNGQVTLSEAYSYAYNRTLVSTAETAVGSQHVTLETELKGKGEMVLSHPSRAEATLRLPLELEAELLIYGAENRVVSAELHKAPGSPMSLALVPGVYEALLREDGELYRCELELPVGATTFYRGSCELVPQVTNVDIKGTIVQERLERFMVELGAAGGRRMESDFTDRLDEFGFDWNTPRPIFEFTGSLAWTARPYLGAVLSVGAIEYAGREREFDDEESTVHTFEWQTWRAALQARGSLPLLHGWLTPYLQGGAGPAVGLTRYEDPSDDYQERERQWGWHLTGAAGLQFMPTTERFRHVGLYHQIEYSYAPVVHNLIGDVHDSGGVAVSMGLRAGF